MKRMIKKQVIYLDPLNLTGCIALGIVIGGTALMAIEYAWGRWEGEKLAKELENYETYTPTLKPEQSNKKPGCAIWTQIVRNEKDPKYREQYIAKMQQEC